MVFFQMHNFHQKITRPSVKEVNTAHSKEQNKSPETEPKKTLALELLSKDFKTIFLSMLNEIEENMYRQLNKFRKTIHEQNNTINQEIKIIKKEPNSMELNTTIAELKNSLEEFNNIFTQAEKTNRGLEDGSLEIVASEK